MRILGGRIWLAAVTALPLVAADRVEFSKGFEGKVIDGNASAVIPVVRDTHQHWTFHWVTTDPVEVSKINLWVKNMSTLEPNVIDSGEKDSGTVHEDHEGEGEGSSSTAAPAITPARTRPSVSSRATDGAVRKEKRQDHTGMPGTLEVTSDVNRGSVKVPDLQTLLMYSGMPLFFEAIWSDGLGSSYSRAFTVLLEDLSIDQIPQVLDYLNPKPYMPQNDTRNGASIGTDGTSTGTLPEMTSQASSNGLPTGAIAGIAVGCSVVGLLLIAFLVWFLLKRRRQQQEDSIVPYGATRSRTDELIAEKEANAGVDQGPHSPYSDVEGSLHQVNSGGTAAAIIPPAPQSVQHSPQQSREVPRSFTPYSDRPSVGGIPSPTQTSPITATDPASLSADAGRVTPHGLPAQYAHLVEEGMTEDEIRRLEEEERQLDAAIEQAGRRQ